MGHRDYGPGYRGGREERDIERGRFGDRGELERYGTYGRERYETPYDREFRGGGTAGGYEEGMRNREFDPGRWGSSREREYNDIAGEPGNFGPAGNRFRDAGSRDRFTGRGPAEGRGLGYRDEFEGRGVVDRGYYDREMGEHGYRGRAMYEDQGEFSGGYDSPRGYGRDWGVGGTDISQRSGRPLGFMGGSTGAWRYGGQLGYGESVGYGRTAGMREGPVNYAGRGPRGYRRSDDAIRDEINERLTRHPEIDATDVEVRVEGSAVVLTGVVEDRRAKRLAEDIAEEVWGVDDVRNELKVRHGILAKLTGEQADEREIARATSRETTGTTTSETARRSGRTNATAGSGAGSTSGT